MTTFNTTMQQDLIDAGIGNDTVSSVFAELQQNDTINGGDGIDTLIITGGSAEDTISIDASDITNQLDINGTKVTGFEHFDLSNFTEAVTFKGSTGNDWIKSGNEDDLLSGDNGDDYLNGGVGIDILIGGRGNDTYVVDNLGDIVYESLNSGIDTIQSSVTWTLKANLENLILVGTDIINGTGNKLNNTLTGNVADNQLSGNAGNDTLIGSTGNDTLNGGEGNDTADYSQLGQSITLSPTGIITKGGGLGNDQLIEVETIIADASAVNNTIDGSTAGNTAFINVNLQTQQLTINGVETFTVTNFDHVQGTSQDDSITGDTQNNQLSGNAGNDTIFGGAGNDTISGDDGNDTADYSQIGQSITLSPTGIITKGGGLGNDQLIQVETIIADASAVNNTIDGSTAGNAAAINVNLQTQQLTINGVETLTVTNFDNVQGTSQNDSITGDTQDNQLSGNAGNDTLIGSTGNDTLNGGEGNDTADYSQLGQSITLSPTGIITKGGGLGNDQLIEVETIIADASAVNNTIDGSTAGNTAFINVNLQTQQLTINGVETFTVTNFDHVQGTSQNDTIIGDTQNNQLSGNAGNDSLNGGAGNDTLNGGEGNDTADYSQIGQSITLSPTGIITKGGGLGNDQLIQVETIIADASAVNNTIDGSTAGNTAFINVNLQTQQLTINGVETFTVTNFDHVQGTSQNDTIIGDTQNNQLSGNAGNDSLNGGAGNDTLNGGEGNDTADYSQIGQSITLSPTGIITKGGGLGNDQLIQVETIIADASAVNNTIDGSTAGNAAAINVNLQTQQLTVNGVPGVGTFTVTNFDHVQGTSQNDTIIGDTQNNQLSGNAGNDSLNGGAGNDTLNGGEGDDIYIIDSTTDIITENVGEGTDTIQSSVTYTIATNVENLTLTETDAINGTGNDVNNIILGNSANNIIFGNAGNDTLDGGGGSDALIGGAGDDIYIVDSTTDIITENANGGTDTIQSSVTFTLTTNVENLTLTGTAAINGTGNAGNNIITGNGVNNTLEGGAGIDTLIGGTGNDIYIVDSTTDIITENANGGTDTIQSSVTFTLTTNVENLTLTGTAAINGTGNAGNNIITGNGVNNTLEGGAGIDTLIGGTGNDIYIVDSTTDIITENANGGTDTIQSSVTFTLTTNVENLTLTGTAAINGTGNAGNNIITGNGVNNTLEGGAGIDTLIGGTGNDIYIVNSTTDIITENANGGTDTIQSSVTFSIDALTNVENLTLTGTTAINGTGNAGNNIITGNNANNVIIANAGNDTLDGGDGSDALIGGTGNDIYLVNSTTDTITENANEGTDTIQSSVTFTIATLTNVENLTLTGTTAINGTGNAGNNIITGNGVNNTLTGGVGKDTLTGGLGVDRFDYRTLADSVFSNFDVITDFSANTGNDLFLVSTARSGFSNAGTVVTLDTNGIAAKLTTAAFTANSAAQFSFGSRSFVALNDVTAGFSATTDAIIEVTGLTGTLGLNNFTTSLV